MRFLRQCLVIGNGFLLIVGLLLRVTTIRDSIPYLSVFFYATPVIVLVLSALILCCNRAVTRQWRAASIWGLLAVVLWGWWHMTAHYSHSANHAAADRAVARKLLFWNVGYVKSGWPAIIEELQKHDADVIGLAEVGPGYRSRLDTIRAAFPEHQLLWVRHGILLVRGEVKLLELGWLNDHGEYAVVRSRLSDGEQLDIVLVDIFGFVLMPRGPALRSLDDVLARYAGAPVCIMGDFNTPPDSVFFGPLRKRFENAYEASGNGYYVTWPSIAPVLALDQIWLPPGTSVSSELKTTRFSDHRIVTAVYDPGH